MNKNMKKYTYLVLLFILPTLLATQVNAQVDSSFSYQGELQDNNSPANDNYDFVFNLTDSDGFPFGDPSEHLNTEVVNGLFSLRVDFNVDAFDGFGNVSFSIEVRKSSDGGAYTTLGSQTIRSVPLATNLTNGDATTGEVLTFNGFQWAPMTPSSSPWSLTGSTLSYTAGNVGIGTTGALADLMIEGTTDGNVLRVRVDNTTKFIVDDNGGTSIGSITEPPVNGLYVQGDVTQPISSDGMMKYMVHVFCNLPTASIIKSYNGVNNGNISVSNDGNACVIDFPTDIDDRYFQASPVFGGTSSTNRRAVNCRVGDANNQLLCAYFDPEDGSSELGSFMVLIY